jgi:hypothetical protein
VHALVRSAICSQGAKEAPGSGLAIAWAGISRILNLFIEAHHNQLGMPIRRDGLPRDLTAKLDYIKKVEKDLRDPAKIAELGQMRLELAELNEKRINLTHGLLMRQGYGPQFTIYIAKESGHTLLRKDLSHSGEDVFAFSKELSEMGGGVSRFSDHSLQRPRIVSAQSRIDPFRAYHWRISNSIS